MSAKKSKKFIFSSACLWRVMFPALVIVTGFALAVVWFVGFNQASERMEASGRVNASFRVHYLENAFFTENPVMPNLNFLMSFTDFIEVGSRFTAQFSEIVEVYYSYTATMRFVIRYRTTADGNLNPVVFEEQIILAEISGQATADSLNFSADSGQGGHYTIFPYNHVQTYMDFVSEHTRMINKEGFVAQNLRGFSAELFVDFRYNVHVPKWGLNETAEQGYRISLTTEIFSLMLTGGNGSVFDSVIYNNQELQLPLYLIIIFVAVVAFCAYALFKGIQKMQADPNEHKHKICMILRKYSNEIVVCGTLLPLSPYTVIPVDTFDVLLKLALNLGKHIMCYNDNEYAEFAVIVDNNAYFYCINCAKNNDEAEITDAVVIKNEVPQKIIS